MHKFGITLYWSDVDSAFVDDVPELPWYIHTVKIRKARGRLSRAQWAIGLIGHTN